MTALVIGVLAAAVIVAFVLPATWVLSLAILAAAAAIAVALTAGLVHRRTAERDRALQQLAAVAAEEARNVETKYGALARLLPLVVYVYKPHDRTSPIYVSPEIETLLGYTASEWLAEAGLSTRLVHPKDRERVTAAAAEAARTESPFAEEYRILARDGRVVWVRDESVTVRDESGAALCIQGYLRDVTPEKNEEEERGRFFRAEQTAIAQAQEERERMRLGQRITELLGSTTDYDSGLNQVAELLVERMADWCIVDVADESGALSRRIVVHAEPRDANHVAENAPSSEPDAVARRVVNERRPELRPESSEARQLPVVGGTEAESYVAVPLLSRRRALGALTLLSSPGGRRFGFDDLAFAQDVARRAALVIENARLHGEVEQRSDAMRVLTHVADGVFLLDRRGIFRLLNPAAEAMTGLDAESVIGRAATEVIPGWEEVADRIPIATSHEEPVHAETVPFETANGERWFSAVGVNFFGGTVYALRDVTDARRLDELKAEFVATASHELRTPLAAVYGAAQTLRRHDFALDETGRERFISLISEESERLSRIVNDILLANQLDADRLDLEAEPFDAGELVDRVAEAARMHLPPTTTIDVSLPESPLTVAADRDKARQVLVNLVENAIKYSPDGGRVVVGAEVLESTVRFFVSDNGMGIPEHELERIFDKFYRLDPEMTRGIGGTGLGLYICSELVRRMGGRIWAKSARGEGSEFSFELPLAEGSVQRAVTPELRGVAS